MTHLSECGVQHHLLSVNSSSTICAVIGMLENLAESPSELCRRCASHYDRIFIRGIHVFYGRYFFPYARTTSTHSNTANHIYLYHYWPKCTTPDIGADARIRAQLSVFI